MSDIHPYEAILKALEAIIEPLGLEETLNAIATQAAIIANAEASSVLLIDTKLNKLVFKAAYGKKADALIDQAFDINLGIAGKTITTGKTQIIPDASKSPDFFSDFDSKLGFKTRDILSVPMRWQGIMLGVIEILNSRNPSGFQKEDIEAANIFAHLASIAVFKASKYEQLRRHNQLIRTFQQFPDIIGAHTSLREVMQLVIKVAPTDATVLITGSTGTGKELIARAIHRLSPRKDNPFVPINCAAIPENLVESELFGYEKGAFTGASSRKLGLFELADGGTIFLDEVGELTPMIQVKLLRVLQEKSFLRIGGTRPVSADIRVIAATNRDLEEAIREKKFREDLYYRLNVFPIKLPDLKDRQEDIPLLVNYYKDKYCKELNTGPVKISEEAMELLCRYNWPGNIRELQNVIERAVLLSADGLIRPKDLPIQIRENTSKKTKKSFEIQSSATSIKSNLEPKENSHEANKDDLEGKDMSLSLKEREKLYIMEALRKCKWNKSAAARMLGVSRDYLRYRIRKYRIKPPSQAE